MPEPKRCLLPCKSCPWRIENDASVIPGYNQEKACGLLSTVGKEDAFRKIMACHNSTDKNMIPCRGYLAKEGWNNLSVRLMAIQGKIPFPDQISDACKKMRVKLERNYPLVLKKLSKK